MFYSKESKACIYLREIEARKAHMLVTGGKHYK